MVKTVLSSLPIELLHFIAQHLRKRHLLRLIRVCNGFLHINIPLIYSDINLLDLSVVSKCLQTMLRNTAFNLPGMVRSLTIRNERHNYFPSEDYGKFEKNFYRCLDKMDALKDLKISGMGLFFFGPSLLHHVFISKHLRSVEINHISDTPGNDAFKQRDWTLFESPAPRMQNLVSFQLSGSLSDRSMEYLTDFVNDHADQLQTLSLNLSGGGLDRLRSFQSGLRRPALTTLSLPFSAFFSTALFEQTPKVTSLTIFPTRDSTCPPISPFPSHMLPSLTYVAGPSQLISQLQLLRGRPKLSCVELDGATFSMEPDVTGGSFITRTAPDWGSVLGVLHQMQDANVKRVAFCKGGPLIDELESVVSSIKKVEHLKVLLYEHWSVSGWSSSTMVVTLHLLTNLTILVLGRSHFSLLNTPSKLEISLI